MKRETQIITEIIDKYIGLIGQKRVKFVNGLLSADSLLLQNFLDELVKIHKDLVSGKISLTAGNVEKEDLAASIANDVDRGDDDRQNLFSTVRVISEQTIDDFQKTIQSRLESGFLINYINIDTHAGNSQSGVRYYAVVSKTF